MLEAPTWIADLSRSALSLGQFGQVYARFPATELAPGHGISLEERTAAPHQLALTAPAVVG